jgi:hypothetical protein
VLLQIVKSVPLTPGEARTFAIRYTGHASHSSVVYVLDGDLFARVDHVGIPLDVQGVDYTGVYSSYGGAHGEELGYRMDTFIIGHGLFNVLDAFPFQHPGAPGLAVSIPLAERLFGQGAEGEFSKFAGTTTYE